MPGQPMLTAPFLLLAVVRIADSAMIYQYLAKEAARAAQGDDAHACSRVEVARTNMVSTEISTATVLYRAETRDGPSPGRVRVALEGALGGSCALVLPTPARARRVRVALARWAPSSPRDHPSFQACG